MPRSLSRKSAERKEEKAGSGRNIGGALHLTKKERKGRGKISTDLFTQAKKNASFISFFAGNSGPLSCNTIEWLKRS